MVKGNLAMDMFCYRICVALFTGKFCFRSLGRRPQCGDKWDVKSLNVESIDIMDSFHIVRSKTFGCTLMFGTMLAPCALFACGKARIRNHNLVRRDFCSCYLKVTKSHDHLAVMDPFFHRNRSDPRF